MRGLFSRASPSWSDWEQVRYAHRNMLSEYRLGLPLNERTTMDGLELAASRHERILTTATVRRPPPRPEHTLCPSFAYRGSSGASQPSRRHFLNVQRADEVSDARGSGGEDADNVEYVDAVIEPHAPRKSPKSPTSPKRVTFTGNPRLPWHIRA